MPTLFDDLLLLVRSLATVNPWGTLIRASDGSYYIQTAIPSGNTYVKVIDASGPAAPTGVITVATSGGQYTAIEDALAAAASGQTVLVYPGTYEVPATGLVVPAGVTLQGVSRDDVVLDGVTQSPNTAVELSAGSVVSDLEILVKDAVSVRGVMITGANAVAKNLRIGAATATLAPIGIDVIATGAEIRDIVFYTAIGTGLSVQGVGEARALGLVTEGVIVGTALTYIVRSLGVLFLLNSNLRTTGEGIEVANGGTLDGAGITIAPNLVAFNVDGGAGVAFLHLAGCYAAGEIIGSAHANEYIISGCSFTAVTIAQASASSLLPSRLGRATVLSGNQTVVVVAGVIGGAAYDGRPVAAQMLEADGAVAVGSCTWDGSGNLTIRLTGAASANRPVAWFLPG